MKEKQGENRTELLLLWNTSSRGDSLILPAKDKKVFSELINAPFPWKLLQCKISTASYQAFPQPQEWEPWDPIPAPPLPPSTGDQAGGGMEIPAGREGGGEKGGGNVASSKA